VIAERGDEDLAASTVGDRLSDLFRPTIKICHQHRRRLLPVRAAGHQQGKIIGQVQAQATGLRASAQNADRLCWTEVSVVTRPRESFQNLFSLIFLSLSLFFLFLSCAQKSRLGSLPVW
jgi:hypothetical protein